MMHKDCNCFLQVLKWFDANFIEVSSQHFQSMQLTQSFSIRCQVLNLFFQSWSAWVVSGPYSIVCVRHKVLIESRVLLHCELAKRLDLFEVLKWSWVFKLKLIIHRSFFVQITNKHIPILKIPESISPSKVSTKNVQDMSCLFKLLCMARYFISKRLCFILYVIDIWFRICNYSFWLLIVWLHFKRSWLSIKVREKMTKYHPIISKIPPKFKLFILSSCSFILCGVSSCKHRFHTKFVKESLICFRVSKWIHIPTYFGNCIFTKLFQNELLANYIVIDYLIIAWTSLIVHRHSTVHKQQLFWCVY